MQSAAPARNIYVALSRPHTPRVMDIHIILNPGAIGTPPKAQSSKKTPRRGTPTNEQSSPGLGSAIHRRSLRSSSLGAAATKPYATPIQRHSSLRHGQTPLSPLLRQSRTRKHGLFEEAPATAAKPREGARRGRSSTHSSSAGSSTTTSATSPSLASLLLSRAKQHVELEAVTLGRRTRSIMDVVMDLKGPAVAYQEDVLMFIAERTHDAPYLRKEYAFTADDGGLAAYWADQAAIWDGANWQDADAPEDILTRFPVSMERSTAAWEYP
ncbi:hypothetical protein FB451DRAFT_1384414 [Mycena latifolia]|nr:hypothetical protein FB451DRAFT_1384414 [Mycena latifolia]